jgi:hypothetical protein
VFWVTHPYHPLSGQRFVLVQYRHTWGAEQVYYHDAQGHLRSLPAGWTSLALLDPFVALAGGRSLFRAVDLLALAQLCGQLTAQQLREEGTDEHRPL